MKKYILILGIAYVACSCGGGNTTNESTNTSQNVKDIQIDGSSTVYPVSSAIAEEFMKAETGVNITISESGSGGGFKKFIRQEIDIANASRPITKKEDSLCKAAGVEYLELPIAYDGLVVVVNPKNTWVDYLKKSELKKMWEPAAEGKITKWSQIRQGWPDEEIHLYGAGTASGTFDYFTEAICGKAKAIRKDYNPSENDNVLVQGISSDRLALGYFGIHYYKENSKILKLVPIDDEDDTNGKGPIYPNEITVKNGTYQPLSRPLFIYVNKKSTERPEVDKFIQYYLDSAAVKVPETGYITLNKSTYELVKKRYLDKITGSLYLDIKTLVGIRPDELYMSEASQTAQ
ncbi:MAG: PstS family phosphate ABC transporter substrate-binding protein [Cytophagaceae bacterium]|nr:PstS family phosphate ABC transporter substrate-binding protein [Cytophagaceae bacterium]MDW8455290.1 PstS family phosphate ABC transporter substrate-binding protein [Cytophagaceae bacterium]